MKSKLNLTIDYELKLFASKYVNRLHTSVSNIVEQYFRDLQKKEALTQLDQETKIRSPKVKAIFNSLNVDPDVNWKENRLKEKYLND